MADSDYVTITVRVPLAMKQAVEAVVEEQAESLTHAVRQGLVLWLDEPRRQRELEARLTAIEQKVDKVLERKR